MNRNNILLITMDQLSLHALSCYESYLCRTPAVDQLARDGILFRKAYTPCALCTPARASLLSGVYPHSHGALHNSGIMLPFSESRIGMDLESFPLKLKEAGYSLGYQGKWHAGIAETANDLGFEGFGPRDYGHYKESPNYRSYLDERGLKDVEEIIEFRAQSEDNWMDTAGYVKGSLETTGSYFITDETMRMISGFSERQDPFFMWLSFWGPHAPYWPHESYIDLYPPEQIRKWGSFDENPDNKPVAHRRFRETVMKAASEADWETWSWIISRYYAQVTMIDEQIGRLIRYLKENGLYDDMLLIFTADHGDSLGIHGGVFDKGAMAYEQIYNIPMIIKMPGGESAGKESDEFVSLLDLSSTFCDTAGIEYEKHGKSLIGLVHGDDEDRKDYMFAEFHGHRFPVAQRIIWLDNFKYVLNFADFDELYNVKDDPEEVNNLADLPEYGNLLKKMRTKMLSALEEYEDNMHPQARCILQ